MSCHGTVYTGRNNIFTIGTADGLFLCRIKGKVLALDERAYNPLAPGDRVEVSLDESAGEGVIVSRLPRRNAFSRYNTKRSAEQTIAANIDLVVVVASATDPAFLPDFVDRATVLADRADAEVLVAVTKRDLDPQAAMELAQTYERLGFGSVAISPEEGAAELRPHLVGHRSVFVGQSGVGKSTLINALLGNDLQATGAISKRYASGRHTTNASQLIAGDSFELIDTPGVRALDCRHLESDSLDLHFPEFHQFIDHCGHANCQHDSEPGCSVRAAVADRCIPTFRFQSYLRILREIRVREESDW